MDTFQNAATTRLLAAVTLISVSPAITKLQHQTIDVRCIFDSRLDTGVATFAVSPAATFSYASAKLDRMHTEAREELQRYLDFGPGWDGYDGLPFSPTTVSRAEAILDQLHDRLSFAGVEPLELTPGPIADGRIDIEVATRTRHLVVTVDPDEAQFGIAHEERGGVEEVAVADERGLERWLDWIAGTSRLPALLREAAISSGPGEALARRVQERAAEEGRHA